MDAVMGVGLGEELVRLRTVTRQLEAAASAVSQRFASSYEWEADGARSAVNWLHGSGNDGVQSARSVIERGGQHHFWGAVGERCHIPAISTHIKLRAELRR